MPNLSIDRNRIDDKTQLLLKFNYTSSILSFLLALICIYAIDVQGTIPFVFLFYFALNLLNIGAFKLHHNLTSMAINTSVLSWVGTVIITLFSGGINSPFIFVLAIIVLAGYIATRVFGRIYLYFITFTIFLIFFVGLLEPVFISNEVPEKSRDIFSLFSLLFSVYLLGGIFGKDLLKAHHSLYKSKAEIEKRIHEKETLLREVHHRVKNNLQTVSSLLNLQAKNSTNQKIKDLVKSSQNRVTSMAMIHEMLYTHNDLSKIAFRPYVKELTDYLLNSFKDKDKNINIHIAIPDTKLSIDTAIPLGLLINETVTNSLKYGFVDKQEGQIEIALITTQRPNTFVLKIADNGIGFSEHLDHRTTDSLGLKLIHNLARQLKGSVERTNSENGTTYTIHFQEIER